MKAQTAAEKTYTETEIRDLKRRLERCELRIARLEACFNFIVTIIREGKLQDMPRLLHEFLDDEGSTRRH